jgi:hypothetical protein
MDSDTGFICAATIVPCHAWESIKDMLCGVERLFELHP